MNISDEDAEGFRQIYIEEIGEPISNDEAREVASRVLRLYEAFLDVAERILALEKAAQDDTLNSRDGAASTGRDPYQL